MYSHPNILRLFGYFDDDERIYLVIEYGGKYDLFQELERRQRFPEAETVKVSADDFVKTGGTYKRW